MKKHLLTVLLLAACLLAACASPDTGLTVPAGYAVMVAEDPEQDFSILYNSSYTASWNEEDGIVIRLNADSDLPNVRVKRVLGSGFEVETYFQDYFEPALKEELQERFISGSEISDFSLGGKTLPGDEYRYSTLEGATAVFLRCFELLDDSVVMFTLDAAEEDADIAAAALEDLVRSFQVGAHAYDGASIAAANNGGSSDQSSRVHIVPTAASQVKLEHYDNGLVSLELPVGWQVQTCGSYAFYALRAYDPTQPDRQILAALKFEGAVKSQAAHDWYVNTYGADYIFSRTMIIEDQSTESFYKNFNTIGELNNTNSFHFPALYNFSVIENFGASPLGGDLLRATYTSEAALQTEGIFTATVRDLGPQMVNIEPWNIFSDMIDAGWLNIYDVFFITTPEYEFSEWQPLLDACLGSLTYSDAFLTGFNQEQNAAMDSFRATQQICNEISDLITSSWEARNTTYDILSEKQSDATLGYERVYDVDTNEVYRAYNGFGDINDESKYKPITDDMYNLPIAGYIEK